MNILNWSNFINESKKTDALKPDVLAVLKRCNSNPKHTIYLELLDIESLKDGLSQAQITKILNKDKKANVLQRGKLISAADVNVALNSLEKDEMVKWNKVNDVIKWSIK